MKENPKTAHLLRPGPEGWEVWKFPQGGSPEKLPGIPTKIPRLTVAPSTATLMSMALWVAPDGNFEELAELEFSSRHLFRKGQTVKAFELEKNQDRALVLCVLGSDDPSLEGLDKEAKTFEIPARLFSGTNRDGVVWKEHGQVSFAFFRGGKCAYFSSTGEEALSQALSDSLGRCAQRLHAEEVLPEIPERILLAGPFSPEETTTLARRTGWSIEPVAELTPLLPDIPSDMAPPAAVARRERERRLRRTGRIAAIAGTLYGLLILVVATSLFLNGQKAAAAEKEAAQLEAPAEEARAAVTRWQAIRPAIDPDLFAIDILAAVAAALPAETVRLTSLSLEKGDLIVAGEAADVSQTYEMLDRLKQAPQLQDFEWTGRPPDIASKTNVRFQFEGRRLDALAAAN